MMSLIFKYISKTERLFLSAIFWNTDGAILAWNSINHMWPVQPTLNEFNAYCWPSAKNIDNTSVIQRIHELTNVSQLSTWVLQYWVQITCLFIGVLSRSVGCHSMQAVNVKYEVKCDRFVYESMEGCHWLHLCQRLLKNNPWKRHNVQPVNSAKMTKAGSF